MIIHIIAKGPGFLDAPDPTGNGASQVWGLNDVPLSKKIDVLFNMHDLTKISPPNKLCLVVAEQDTIPLYTLKKYEWLSNSIEYPLDEIIEEFGIKYFSCSTCYMLALAIYNGATEIHTWGVAYHTDIRDAPQERAGVEFWMGVAIGRGVKVVVSRPSAVLQTSVNNELYGYENNDIDFSHKLDEEAFFEQDRTRIEQVRERINSTLTTRKPSLEEN